MRLTPTAAVALAALSLLAACGPKGGGNATASASGPAASAAASGPDVSITMADLPRPKAGLWQSTIDDGDGKPSSKTTCYSGKAPNMPKMPPGCSQLSIKRTFLGAIVMDMNCATPDFTMVMHSTVTGDFQNKHVVRRGHDHVDEADAAQDLQDALRGPLSRPCAPGRSPTTHPTRMRRTRTCARAGRLGPRRRRFSPLHLPP